MKHKALCAAETDFGEGHFRATEAVNDEWSWCLNKGRGATPEGLQKFLSSFMNERTRV